MDGDQDSKDRKDSKDNKDVAHDVILHAEVSGS